MDILLQKQYKILLVGESSIDVYALGNVDRHYNESKINNVYTSDAPIFEVKRLIEKNGMALNVRESFLNLGHNVTFLTNKKKIQKKRYILEESQEHFMRSDENDVCKSLDASQLESLKWGQYDFVVISDYNKGLVTPEIVKTIVGKFKGHIFVDTKKTDLRPFENCILKINQFENERVEYLPKNYELIVTSGEKGAVLMNKTFKAHPTKNVIDICGAGDNFLVGLSLMMHTSNDIEHAIRFANYCASRCLDTVGNKSITKQDAISYVKD